MNIGGREMALMRYLGDHEGETRNPAGYLKAV